MLQSLPQILAPLIRDVFQQNGQSLDQGVLLCLEGKAATRELFVRHYAISARHFPPRKNQAILTDLARPQSLSSCIFFPRISSFLKGDFSANRLERMIDHESTEFDWEAHLNDSSQPNALLALPARCEQFFVIPLFFLNTPIAWVIHDRKFLPHPRLYEHLNFSIQLDVATHLFTLFDRDALTAIPDKESLVKWYATKLGALLVASQIRIGDAGWEPFFQEFTGMDYVFKVRLPKAALLAFGFPGVALPIGAGHRRLPFHQTAGFQAAERQFRTYIEQHFAQLLNYWSLIRGRQRSAMTDQISEFLSELRPVQEDIRRFQKRQEVLIEKLEQMTGAKTYSDFEFYKGTTGWIIRWRGQLIESDGDYNTGLGYVQRLLMDPDQEIDAFQLERVYREKGKDYHEVHLDESSSVRVSSNVPESEGEINEAILRLKDGFPKKRNFSSHGLFLEAVAYQLAELLNLYDSLIKMAPKARYIDQVNIIKHELKKVFLDLEAEEGGSSPFYKNVLTKTKRISVPIEYDVQKRRIRQRVTTNLKNAVNSLKSEDLREYLFRVLDIKYRSKYKKTLMQDETDWVLFPDA